VDGPTRTVTLDSTYSELDTVLYVRELCDDGDTEVGCNDDVDGSDQAYLRQALDAGSYFVFLDATDIWQEGRYRLRFAP
jgi:hypothetical protein